MEASSESEDDVTDPWEEEGEDERGTALPERISSKPSTKRCQSVKVTDSSW